MGTVKSSIPTKNYILKSQTFIYHSDHELLYETCVQIDTHSKKGSCQSDSVT